MPSVSSKQINTDWTLLPTCRAFFGSGNLESSTETTAASSHGLIDEAMPW